MRCEQCYSAVGEMFVSKAEYERLEDELSSCTADLSREVSIGNDYLMQVKALKAERDCLAAENEALKTTPADKREDLRCVISDLCQQVRDREAENAELKRLLNEREQNDLYNAQPKPL